MDFLNLDQLLWSRKKDQDIVLRIFGEALL
jgi:hypothetical protein